MSIDLLAEGKYQGKHLRPEEDNPAPEEPCWRGGAADRVAGAPVPLPNSLRGTKLAGPGCGPLRHIFTGAGAGPRPASRRAAVAVPWPGPERAK
jgi:hypothetical protein